ncbi:putative gustatory receptor 58b [Drosophila grimshawi]|uniref:Gustatory receptor n=1 Tax=Drosophila grimshawi TaxID=7222 RepID=B4J8L3_DROGR|nr:putative gustatory receptor 58b [Drosophila grimshawi]EDW01280.1 GH21352 [Drosophila grimshawi]
MLHRRLRLLLKIIYFQMLIWGLVPRKLCIRNGRVSIRKVSTGYLIYSVCLSAILLLHIPLMMTHGIIDGYMRNHIVLQWGLIVSLLMRIIAILSCYGLVWLQRRRLIQLCTDFVVHWMTHWHILRFIAGEDALRQLQMHLAFQLSRKLCVNYAMLSCSIFMQCRLLTEVQLPELLIRFVPILMISVGRITFFTVLVLLSHQFQAVQLALQALRKEARSRLLVTNLRRIGAVHFECLKLAMRAFSLYDVANAIIFLNIFVAQVNILYHAVQFGNKTIASDHWGFMLGNVFVALNIWNSILLMNMVDYAVNSCNQTEQQIRQFNDLRMLGKDSERELELFMTHLRGNRLVYRICHCVILDKPACLGYMASVLCYIIILMQFDLKRRKEAGLRYEDFFNNEKGVK